VCDTHSSNTSGVAIHPILTGRPTSKQSLSTTGQTTPSLLSQTTPSLPWRRSNVRHTSNELYADVVETLSVTLAPSGRPLSAFANGTIAFTSRVSGVPDMTLTLSGPSGKHNLASVIELPVFHPCVRLNRWREAPGELSFVPPDGRFILAGYEVDLLPFTNGKAGSLGANALKLPVSLDVRTSLGATGADFEVRLQLNRNFSPGGGHFGVAQQHSRTTSAGPSTGGGLGALTSGPKAGTAAAPLLEDLRVSIPLPAEVRNLSEIRPTKGDAAYSPGDKFVEWHISNKELGSGGTSFFGLRCTVVGQLGDDAVSGGGMQEDEEAAGMGLSGFTAYDETAPYQAAEDDKKKEKNVATKSVKSSGGTQTGDEDAQAVARNKPLMPSSASVSFAVKGWLPSGIKIESIVIDPRKSRGLAEAVKPYKGVKYLTVSKRGVETRC
jgi:AP-3 complex subunit mu